MMRWLLVEAAQTAAQFDPELKREYYRLKFRRATNVAKVAMARKLALRLYWILRTGGDYAQLVRMQGSPRGILIPGFVRKARLGSPGRLPMVESFRSAAPEVYTIDTTERPEEYHYH